MEQEGNIVDRCRCVPACCPGIYRGVTWRKLRTHFQRYGIGGRGRNPGDAPLACAGAAVASRPDPGLTKGHAFRATQL